MIKFQAKRNKSTQYVIGGVVAVIILCLWVSLPLMTGSSLDSSVSTGNPFKSRVANMFLLGSDIPSEGGAPGAPLSGEMTDNPATSGEDIASSLFQSGAAAEETAETSAQAGVVAVPSEAHSASAGGSAPSGPRGRLIPAASLTTGNSNSMTAGGASSKFFGSGNQKSDLVQLAPADLNKAGGADKRSSLLTMLSSSADKSKLAAQAGTIGAARGGATSAFSGTGKASGLAGSLEEQSAGAGLQVGQTAQDLKKNDPNLNKTKITPPPAKLDAVDEDAEMKRQIKMMLIQMAIRIVVGMVFGMVA